MKILIKGGRILDPLTKRDEVCDVLIEQGRISRIEKELITDVEEVIDASGCYVMPGFIDLHVHLRDPGLTYKETLTTGGQAAARGGVTTICAMPNTNPVIDFGDQVGQVHERAKKECLVNVIQLGAITKGQEGKELADIEGMVKQGCLAISDDGRTVMDASLYRKGMNLAKECGVGVFAHCEDLNMVEGGVMNQDKKAEELGLPGITNAVEDVIVARDILLAKETGAKLHICHCSTKDSVKMLEIAQQEGIHVTGEVCPHHFILSTDDIDKDNGNYKMNPPLRSREDVEALKDALKRDVLNVIATDHAPHSKEEKEGSIRDAMFGVVGLETMASLVYTELVEKGVLTPMQMVEKMSYHPACILGLSEKGSVSVGKVADLAIFDVAKEYVIDREQFRSKGRNAPFHGRSVKGDVRYTLVGGKVVYNDKPVN